MDDRYLELLLKEADFSITDLEKEELYAWIEASEANRQRAKKMREAWNVSAEAVSDIVVDLDDEYAQVTAKLLKQKRGKIFTRVWQVAASLLILAGLFWFGIGRDSLPAMGPQVVEGPQDRYMLEDGSAIWLTEDSKFTFEVVSGMRKAILSGQGYFEIFQDMDRPFEIQTNLGRISVLGTAFEIEMLDDQSMAVKVAEGHVLLSTGRDSMHLQKGELGSIIGGKLERSEIGQPVGAWRLAPIVYDQEEFSNILDQMEKDYLIDFEIEDPQILDCRLSFTMDYQDLSELILILETLIDIKIVKSKDGKYSINGKGCK